VRYPIKAGGYADAEARWPNIQNAMVDAMIRLEQAMRPYLEGRER